MEKTFTINPKEILANKVWELADQFDALYKTKQQSGYRLAYKNLSVQYYAFYKYLIYMSIDGIDQLIKDGEAKLAEYADLDQSPATY